VGKVSSSEKHKINVQFGGASCVTILNYSFRVNTLNKAARVSQKFIQLPWIFMGSSVICDHKLSDIVGCAGKS
jgi:hypothetical protein